MPIKGDLKLYSDPYGNDMFPLLAKGKAGERPVQEGAEGPKLVQGEERICQKMCRSPASPALKRSRSWAFGVARLGGDCAWSKINFKLTDYFDKWERQRR